MDSNIPDFLALMYGLTEEQRCEAASQYNSWQWPDVLAAHKPDGWDEMKNFNPKDHDDPATRDSHPWFRALNEALDITTTQWAQSRHRNCVYRKRNPMTQEQHREWWKENYKQ